MRSDIRLLVPLFLALGLLLGCPTPNRGDDDGADDDDGTGDDDGADDDDTVPPNETDCDDTLDEDQDSLTDCEDPDCAEVAPCNWPESIVHAGTFAFEGYDIDCYVGGWPIPYEVPDCLTTYDSTMGQDLTVTPCAECDRTFEGPFTYSSDTCADLIGSESPTSGAIGLVFVSDTQWEFWGLDSATGTWSVGGTATDDGSGTYVYTTSGVINETPDECEEPQDLGNLVVSLTFAEAAR